MYRGTQFRSRLEARWAAFFDLIGWRWVYEPFDAGGYIPDFLIAGRTPLLVEVGPCMVVDDYREKAAKPDRAVASLSRDLLVVGVSPTPGRDEENCAAGLLGELVAEPEGAAFAWAVGAWGRCFTCGSFGVVHGELSFHLRPCGHHQSGSFGEGIERLELEQLWRRAGNDVQWQASGPQRVGDVLRALR